MRMFKAIAPLHLVVKNPLGGMISIQNYSSNPAFGCPFQGNAMEASESNPPVMHITDKACTGSAVSGLEDIAL